MTDHDKDRDETRRLLYMAIAAKGTKKYNLAGTIINSLKHHHGIDIAENPDFPGVASHELMAKVAQWVNGETEPDDNWLPELIQERLLS